MTDFTVNSQSDLNNAIQTIDTAAGGNFTITFGKDITETGGIAGQPDGLYALDFNIGVSVTIDGGHHVLSGGGTQGGIAVLAGPVTIESLTIEDTVAKGGDGENSGGGGAGLGGGLFVGPNARVTLNDVLFSGDSAVGGAGGAGGGGGAGGQSSIFVPPLGLKATDGTDGMPGTPGNGTMAMAGGDGTDGTPGGPGGFGQTGGKGGKGGDGGAGGNGSTAAPANFAGGNGGNGAGGGSGGIGGPGGDGGDGGAGGAAGQAGGNFGGAGMPGHDATAAGGMGGSAGVGGMGGFGAGGGAGGGGGDGGDGGQGGTGQTGSSRTYTFLGGSNGNIGPGGRGGKGSDGGDGNNGAAGGAGSFGGGGGGGGNGGAGGAGGQGGTGGGGGRFQGSTAPNSNVIPPTGGRGGQGGQGGNGGNGGDGADGADGGAGGFGGGGGGGGAAGDAGQGGAGGYSFYANAFNSAQMIGNGKTGAQGSDGTPGSMAGSTGNGGKGALAGFGGGLGSGSGGRGGGGLGAGGDIFVAQGGVLTVDGGLMSGGSASGGKGANPGQGLGTGIFLQGNEAITLSADAGKTLAVDDQITDETGAGGTGGYKGRLVIDAAGIVQLGTANTLHRRHHAGRRHARPPAAGAAGSGAITFAATAGALVEFGATAVPTEAFDNFNVGDTIEVTGFKATGSHYVGSELTLDGTGGPLTLDLPGINPLGLKVTTSGSKTFVTVDNGPTLVPFLKDLGVTKDVALPIAIYTDPVPLAAGNPVIIETPEPRHADRLARAGVLHRDQEPDARPVQLPAHRQERGVEPGRDRHHRHRRDVRDHRCGQRLHRGRHRRRAEHVHAVRLGQRRALRAQHQQGYGCNRQRRRQHRHRQHRADHGQPDRLGRPQLGRTRVRQGHDHGGRAGQHDHARPRQGRGQRRHRRHDQFHRLDEADAERAERDGVHRPGRRFGQRPRHRHDDRRGSDGVGAGVDLPLLRRSGARGDRSARRRRRDHDAGAGLCGADQRRARAGRSWCSAAGRRSTSPTCPRRCCRRRISRSADRLRSRAVRRPRQHPADRAGAGGRLRPAAAGPSSRRMSDTHTDGS